MPAAPPLQSPSDDLKTALDTQGEREYIQLLSMLQHTQGIFALMLVRSNFTPALRDRLLERLAADLAPAPLSIVRVTKTKYNAGQMLAEAAQFTSGTGVLALVGLEDTPDMVVEGGKEMRRPPALASLNHGREALRRACRLPILVWCSDWVYETLREHAPDFFDHFTGLFHFSNANPNSTAYNDHVMLTIRGHAESEDTLLSQVSEEQRLVRAEVDFYTSEVNSHPEPTPQRAELLIGLTEALRKQTTGNRASLLLQAREAVMEALAILSPKSEPYDWAKGQNILGIIYNELPIGDQAENLMKAIECYQAALHVAHEDTLPKQWAATQNNLGNTYTLLLIGDQSENLTKAIESYQAALRVYREDTLPQMWATTQNNLGNAYTYLPVGDKGENLTKAIACYQAALRVRREDTLPQDWATTQNNLGNAYTYLPVGDKGENLTKAIACYQAALRVRREDTLPQDWAGTLTNLGIVLQTLGDSVGARNAWTNAIRGYMAVGMEDGVRQMQNWIDSLPKEDEDVGETA